MSSNPEHDEQVMIIVSAALRLKPEEREAYIRSASGSDQRLCRDAEEAVDWEERMGGFLQQPILALGDPVHPFETGQIVSDRFQIVREVGAGAMGVVYEAFDRKRNQRIAIKSAKSGFRRQLSPELEAALRVRHPNICLVNEIHTAQTEHGEIDFLTMEFLDGETLSARLSDRGVLSAPDAIEIARQLCAGLAEAHRSGVIHRDLKSANVMLSQSAEGMLRVVITDFGLAGDQGASGPLWGTPRYIAPELWLGEKTSRASDFYALGVILFEMVSGSPPAGDSSSKRPAADVPQNYSRLIEDCLSLQPERRCQAFERAITPGYWRPSAFTRRKLFALGSLTAAGLAGVAWLKRDAIVYLFHPLPQKRFVALLLWPSKIDPDAKPVVSGVIDAIENELTRAEAFDRDLFVIAANATNVAAGQIREICASLGANLALEASGIPGAAQFTLLLKIVDAKTNAVLRQGQAICATAEIALLPAKAIRTAARLLNVRTQNKADERFKPATTSAPAYRAFQSAQELRTRPNDDGLEEAIANYKTALDADPHYAIAYANLALAYSRLYELKHDPGALELSNENASRAIELDPLSAEGHLALAYVFENQGNREKALYEIHQALALDPTNPRTLLWQAQIFARFNRWADAEQANLRLKRERPNYWIAYNDLGYVLQAQGKYREAIETFRAATVAAPGSALAFNNLGALFLKIGNFPEATFNLQKSLTLKPNAIAYSNLAEALRAEGKYDAALPFSQQSVNLDPSDDQNWLNLADCYDALPGRQAQAREAYLRAAMEVQKRLQTDPTDGAAWIMFALYSVKGRSGRDALSLVRKAEQFPMSDVDSELAKARVFELLGRRKDALTVLADCFRKGTTSFEVESVRDFAALRKDPAYSQIRREL